MRDDIVRKLGDQLAQGVESECQVVYVLCEARKLMEKEGVDPRLTTLKLYCHWALHVDLSGRDTIGPFLKTVDKFMYDSFDPNGRGVSPEDHERVRELVYLDSFRQQLGQFLKLYGLPTDLCDSDAGWYTFLTAYSKVIEDGSLIWRAAPGLKTIRQMTFTKEALSEGAESAVPFTIKWEILLQDGRIFVLPLHSNWKLIGGVAYERRGSSNSPGTSGSAS